MDVGAAAFGTVAATAVAAGVATESVGAALGAAATMTGLVVEEVTATVAGFGTVGMGGLAAASFVDTLTDDAEAAGATVAALVGRELDG